MSNFVEPALIRRLAALVYARQPESRGWRMVCASAQGALSALVHTRAHVSDAQMPPGYRVEVFGTVSPALSGDAAYPNLFVRSEGCELPPEVDSLAAAAEDAGLPWMMLEVADASGAIRVYEKDGTRPLFTAGPQSPRLARARLVIRGRERVEVEEMFPFSLRVTSGEPAATFSVEAESPGLLDGVRHYIVDGDGRAQLGGGTLEFDVRCRPGAPDELVVKASGFAADATVSELALPPSESPRRSFRADKPLCLHVLFDRTTLDANSWPVALAAMAGFSQADPDEDEELYQKGVRPPRDPGASRNWNRNVREAFGAALAEQAGHLHGGETYFHLWWFADTPKPGIGDMKAVTALRQAWGEVATCGIGNVRQRLEEDVFGYAPGLDLFDAADEALDHLAAVAEEGVRLRREQHAVLIVGDSPPPPSGKGDVLWERLVARPPRTNARCSPLFVNALRKLHGLGVPVGWLYLTLSESPAATKAAYRDFVEQYQYIIALKQEIFRTLRRLGGADMTVESCDGLGEVNEKLGVLLGKMAQREPEVPLLEFAGAIAGGRVVKTWT